MDTVVSVLPCARNALFGVFIGGLVGGVAGAVDVFTLELKRVPRPPSRDIARSAFAVGLRGAAGTGAVFGLYHAVKCSLGVTKRRHGMGEGAAAGVAAATALCAVAVVRPRPNLVSVGLLVGLDNAPLIMPLLRGE